MDTPHVVILGGGFGGLAAAKALARADVRVTLVDRHNYHLFQPLLYQVATATLSAGDIGAPIRWVLRRASNVRVLLGEARSVDVASRRVQLSDGATLDYDYLIVATGARHAYFGHPEWEAYAPGLKTLDDALLMRRRILLAFERAEREEDAARRGELEVRFGSPRPLAPGAYTAGYAAVARWLPPRAIDSDVWIENIPYNETRSYVRRVLWHGLVYRWLETGQPQSASAWIATVASATASP